MFLASTYAYRRITLLPPKVVCCLGRLFAPCQKADKGLFAGVLLTDLAEELGIEPDPEGQPVFKTGSLP